MISSIEKKHEYERYLLANAACSLHAFLYDTAVGDARYTMLHGPCTGSACAASSTLLLASYVLVIYCLLLLGARLSPIDRRCSIVTASRLRYWLEDC